MEETRTGVRVALASAGRASTATGLPVLDHLLGLLAEKACFDLALEVAPGGADAEVAAAGLALGQALAGPLRAEGAAGYGWAMVPARESLANVVLEVADEPLVVSNVDLSPQRVGGLATDLVARFLQELAAGAGLTLHLRLVDGSEPQNVLEAIFKALGAALGQACRPRGKG